MGKMLKLVLMAVTVVLVLYAASGYVAAASQADALKQRAKALIDMGNGPDGWKNGFFNASESFYGMGPNDLNNTQFIELIAVMIAPSSLSYKTRSKTLIERVERIERLHSGECQLEHFTDVWLKACAPK